MKTSGEPLSDRQRAVLSLLDRYRREGAEVPSLSYLARYFRVHHSTMQEHLSELHRKRYLRAPVPGPPIRELPPLPPLPIPARDEDDLAVAVEVSTMTVLREPVTIEKVTRPGETAPSEFRVGVRNRTVRMKVVQRNAAGQIDELDITERVEG